MGTDKGLIIKDDLPWFLHIGNLIESLGLPVYYSIRSEQLDSYKKYVDEELLIIDDSISEGPLRGVLTALKATNADALLVLACDMQELQTPALDLLLDAYEVIHYDFYAYNDGHYFLPFPAIYSRHGLEKMNEVKSLQQLLKQGNTCSLMMPGEEQFSNFNKLP